MRSLKEERKEVFNMEHFRIMKYLKTLVIGDLHIPFIDYSCLELVLAFIRWWKPKCIVINGDALDCWALSKFSKDPSRALDVKPEIDLAKRILLRIKRAAGPDCKIIYLFGNHEFRFYSYVTSNAPAIHSLISLKQELAIEGIKVIDHQSREQYMQMGEFLIGHFHKVNQHSAYTAKNLVSAKVKSLIQGHTHRMGMYTVSTFSGLFQGFEGGCLCHDTYVQSPNWQQGFITLEPYNNGTECNVFPVLINRSSGFKHFSYQGKIFRRKEIPLST